MPDISMEKKNLVPVFYTFRFYLLNTSQQERCLHLFTFKVQFKPS